MLGSQSYWPRSIRLVGRSRPAFLQIQPNHFSIAQRRSNPQLSHLIQLQQSSLLQILNNLPNRILHTCLLTLNQNLRLLRLLIWRTNPRELLDLASPRLLIQTLGIASLSRLDGDVDKDLNEGERLVLGVAGGRRVQGARNFAVGFVGRDEGCYGDGGAVGEEFGDLT
jgi:hypothetical protein